MKHKVDIMYSFILTQEVEANTEQHAKELAKQFNAGLSDQELIEQIKGNTEIEAIYINDEEYL